MQRTNLTQFKSWQKFNIGSLLPNWSMNRSLIMSVLIYITLSVLSGGCELQEVPFTNTEISLVLPDDAVSGGKDGYSVSVTNIATGRVQTTITDTTGVLHFSLEEGVYNISVTGQKTLTTVITNGTSQQEYSQTVDLSGLIEKILVTGDTVSRTVSLQIAQKGNGFVIKEIYFSGSTTPSKGSYYQDQFIEIYNNTDSVLYADSLSIVESTHLSNSAIYEYSSYSGYLIAGAIYTIPGNGTTYPVEPGKSLVIASLAIDHIAVNANSPVDLSGADFEWYDGGKDVDVPEVPNMVRNFCYSNTIWVMHVKGYHAYALFRPSTSYSEFFSENSVNVSTASGSSVTRVKIPDSLIIDGVELGSAGSIGSKSLSTAIDVSYTYCTSSYSGKSVRRKVLKWVGDRAILQDTNNSGVDFTPDATPSPREVE